MAPTTRSNNHPVMGATRARQGRSGRHVMWVLIFGLALVILGFTAAFLFKADDLGSANVNNGPVNAAATGWTAPEPAAVNPQPDEKATQGSAPMAK